MDDFVFFYYFFFYFQFHRVTVDGVVSTACSECVHFRHVHPLVVGIFCAYTTVAKVCCVPYDRIDSVFSFQTEQMKMLPFTFELVFRLQRIPFFSAAAYTTFSPTWLQLQLREWNICVSCEPSGAWTLSMLRMGVAAERATLCTVQRIRPQTTNKTVYLYACAIHSFGAYGNQNDEETKLETVTSLALWTAIALLRVYDVCVWLSPFYQPHNVHGILNWLLFSKCWKSIFMPIRTCIFTYTLALGDMDECRAIFHDGNSSS